MSLFKVSPFKLLLPSIALVCLSGAPVQADMVAPPAASCLTKDAVTTQMDPPSLYESMAVCLKTKNYKDAAFLYGVGGAYGRFDTFRVIDQTAHTEGSNALTEAFLKMMMSREDKTEFREAMLDETMRGENHIEFCKGLWALGAPTYAPMYMIAKGHNQDIPHTTEAGLVKDFDAKAAWLKSISQQWRCPVDGL